MAAAFKKQPAKLSRTKSQSFSDGFTIVELLIATAVFSAVLLLCASAMLQIGRVYYKGVTTIRTQEVARNIVDDIAQAIQFEGGSVMVTPVPVPLLTSNTPFVLCIGSYRYTVVLGAQRKAVPASGQRLHVLLKDNFPGCNAATAQNLDSANPTASSQDLVPEHMRLSKLSIVKTGNLYDITVKVVTGDDDVLTNSVDPETSCQPLVFGSQSCAFSQLQTVVQKRLP